MKLEYFSYALFVSLASFSCQPNTKEPAGIFNKNRDHFAVVLEYLTE